MFKRFNFFFFFYVTVLAKLFWDSAEAEFHRRTNLLTNGQSLSSREGKALVFVSRLGGGRWEVGWDEHPYQISNRENQPGSHALAAPWRSTVPKRQTESVVRPGGSAPRQVPGERLVAS